METTQVCAFAPPTLKASVHPPSHISACSLPVCVLRSMHCTCLTLPAMAFNKADLFENVLILTLTSGVTYHWSQKILRYAGIIPYAANRPITPKIMPA